MAYRIEVVTHVNDTRSEVMRKNLVSEGFAIETAKVLEVYTVNKNFNSEEIKKIAEILSNPISQKFKIVTKSNLDRNVLDKVHEELNSGFNEVAPKVFDFALEIGFLPGVTDNIATTTKESIEGLTKQKFIEEESVHTSTLIFLKGKITEEDTKKIGNILANKLIQRIHVKDKTSFEKDNGMDLIIPKVHLSSEIEITKIDLNISEEELLKLGKEGILNHDGTRRGPLALEKDYLYAIKQYFEKEDRSPTDIELESLAQTWSEHCKHTIFAAEIDEIKDGLYKGYIKKATIDIRNKKGKDDFCVSVFSDNSGAIIFDENYLITDKAETHNSPSALDPFGGAITGIVGVNRDTIGFGKGAKPVLNKYGFCVGLPDDEEPIYRDKDLKEASLTPKRIFEGVIAGVNAGGNQSGIPTPQGFSYFHKDYKGKPLIFVGTVGLIPKIINGKPSHEKSAHKGDKIVIIGGRTGQDGIHGATFSSETLSAESPATAVQIGDPITQKKFSDAIIKEAREMDLYNSITDDGAGGLSSSVSEMAKECGGCEVDLETVPLKYPNLEPWKIWISESQERMTLSIPEEKLEKFIELMNRREVESTVIGTFTDSGRCIIKYKDEKIMDISMDFLHNGLPKKTLRATYTKIERKEKALPEPENLTETLLELLKNPNIASTEFISRQYDHVVQGGAVLGPLHGKGRVISPASVTKPMIETTKGAVCSQGLYPKYSEIDTYDMAACAIDTAVRNSIAIGGKLSHMALMDNFCWCSSNEPERLGQLKAAAKACYDYAVAYRTPYISGKDSMFNDFNGFDKNGKAIKISAPPTLLVSSLSVMDDVTKAVSLDTKFAGDLVYILGETKDELAGSEYFPEGENIPKVNAISAKKLYEKVEEAILKNMIASALSPSHGGLAATFAKKTIAGQLGMEIDLNKIPREKDLQRNDFILFSETQSRFVVTINPKKKEEFEKLFKNESFAGIGQILDSQKFTIKGTNGKTIIDTNVKDLEEAYKFTFKDY
ncbi:phosphoribosylformylglycinamidine synthase [Candidatus Peregrinibacteria bacterium CG_4_10_14_0_2_um_filter_38_24]|nr:MAG: phosphoribosylformylglycinamidine synthase [Candidatus Peregrinibacteria bacterium CG_4_10_14_0_2_um_filter_38_24]PJC38547.1 MAG: phosphoribosylformylglycinamidine synthase [Candidatus Peregrinibacteria bacterium CG_4_9_14_0_2_um_filter_38_9]